MTQIPTLETERLVLRPMEMKDWSRYEILMRSERAAFMGGPYSRKDAWGMFCSDAAQWMLLGHGCLMIEEKGSGVCLGQVGINGGPLYPEKEIGWFVYKEAEGNGFALEAATAMRNWAFETLGLASLVSYIDPDNDRSANLAIRMGAMLDEEADRPSPGDLVFRHDNAFSQDEASSGESSTKNIVAS